MSGQPTSNEEGARDTMSQSQGKSQGGDATPAEPLAQQASILDGQQAAQESSTLAQSETSVEDFARMIVPGAGSPIGRDGQPGALSSPPPPDGMSYSFIEGEGDDEGSLIDYNEEDPGLEGSSHSEPLANPGVSDGSLETELPRDTPQGGPSPGEAALVGNPAAVEQNAPATGNVLTSVFASELAKLDQSERLSLGFNPQGQPSDSDQ